MTGPWIDDDEWAFAFIDHSVRWRLNADEHVIHRSLQLAPVHDEFTLKLENMRRKFRSLLLVMRAALTHDIEGKNAPLPRIDPIVHRMFRDAECAGPSRRWAWSVKQLAYSSAASPFELHESTRTKRR